jgi:PD-(D/E)XK nuclease superfamily
MRRLKPKTAATPLRFGSLLHTALEGYYIPGKKRGPHPTGLFEKAYEQEFKDQVKLGFKDEDGTWSELGELGISMLDHYIATYGADDEYEVIAAEQRFESPIVTPRGNRVGIFIGVIDLVMRHLPTKYIELWDHKGMKSISTGHLSLDSQKSAYWTYGVDWLLKKGILKDGAKLRTFRYNFLRKAKPDEREWEHGPDGQKLYLNKDGTVSKVQPSAHFVRWPVPMSEATRELQRQMVIGELRDISLVRAGKLDMYKSPSMFNCMSCDVRDICELHEHGGDFEEMAALTTIPKDEWTPIEYTREAIEDELEH